MVTSLILCALLGAIIILFGWLQSVERAECASIASADQHSAQLAASLVEVRMITHRASPTPADAADPQADAHAHVPASTVVQFQMGHHGHPVSVDIAQQSPATIEQLHRALGIAAEQQGPFCHYAACGGFPC